jgi:hypothetical protein
MRAACPRLPTADAMPKRRHALFHVFARLPESAIMAKRLTPN